MGREERRREREEQRAAMRALLEPFVAQYRQRSYRELRDLVEARSVETAEVRDSSGAAYGIEILFYWDDRRGGDVRVIASIERIPERRRRRLWFVPYAVDGVSDDFIMAPDGSFVGE